MVAKYTEFTVGDLTYKAYHSLENLFRIESTGVNLTELGVSAVETPPSFTQTRDIMMIALKADIPDLQQRTDFVREYMDRNRFKACNKVREFILAALTSPTSEGEDDSEKKGEAS